MTKTMLVVLIAASLALGGCGKKSDETRARTAQEKAMEKSIEKSSGDKANVDLSKEKMTFQTKEGGKVEIATGEAGVKVPDDFPKDVLVYKGAKVDSSVKSPEGMQVMLSTADPADKVAEAYKTEMTKSGWTEKTSMAMAEMTMLEYTKDQRTATVNVMKGDGKGAKVMLVLTKKDAAK